MTARRTSEAPKRAGGKFTPGGFDVVVFRSSAGLGLSTRSAIAKGACILEYTGRVISKEEETTSRSKYLFAVGERKTIDGAERQNLARYINHSCAPNCEPEIHKGRVYILARRNIKPGEELVYDYGKEYFNAHIKPKGCRCAKCAPNLLRQAPAR